VDYSSVEQPGIGGTLETTELQQYRAQFFTIIEELESARAEWARLVCFMPGTAHAALGQQADQIASDWMRRDESSLTQVERRLPEYWRKALIKHLYSDLARAYILGADISPDSRHEKLLRHQALSGTHNAPDSGVRTLTLRLPDVRKISWEQINDLRQDPGINALRTQLRECDAAGGSDLEVIRRIDEQYARDMERYRRSWKDTAITVAWNLISAVPGMGLIPAVVQTGIAFKDAYSSRRHWTASLMRLQRHLQQ
jgi:hypothetical protein